MPGLARGWLIPGFLAVNVALLLAALSCAHITADGPAKRGLARAIGVLTEADAYVERNFEALQEEARETRAPSMSISDFAVEVTFETQELARLDAEAFRSELLERAAERVHDDGASAFSPEEDSGARLFSAEGALRRGLDVLRPAPHAAFSVLTLVFAITAGALALAAVLSARGPGGLVALGAGVFAGSLVFLFAAIGAWLALGFLAGRTDDYFAHEFLRLAEDLTWAPVRNGALFAAMGVVIAAAGFLSGRLPRAERSPARY